jgi:hypothetical protein
LCRPLELVCSLPPIQYARENLPGMKAILASPTNLQDLARVAVASAIGDVQVSPDRILTVRDILREST